MKPRQTGIGRIELIVVIVILVLAAGAAVPRKPGVADLAQAAASAMTVNYAGCATTGQQPADRTCVRVTSCSQARQLMHGALPQGHRVEGESGQGNGDSLRCRLVAPDGASAHFTGLVAGA